MPDPNPESLNLDAQVTELDVTKAKQYVDAAVKDREAYNFKSTEQDLPIQESLDVVQQAKDSGISSGENGGIVICPFACVPELQLSQPVWKPVVRTLETYGERLWLMGEEKQRMDGCRFTEADIASNLPLTDKMKVLASATLVIGSPNRWLWMSTVWERKIIVLYPEGEPSRKWFGFQNDNFGRILYQPDNVQVPALLACVRKLISIL